MKILHLYPRQTGTRPIHVTIPKRYTYFWEISSYLSDKYDIESIDAIDQKYSIFDLSKKILCDNVSIVILLLRIENLHQGLRFINFIKTIKPNLRFIVYGDVVNLLPRVFKRDKLIDSVVVSGDWELSISSYIEYLKNGDSLVLSGVYVRDLDQEFSGKCLDESWKLSDLNKAPVNYYHELNGNRQVTITVSRGCPFNCKYCYSVATFGSKDRRLIPSKIVEYIKVNSNKFNSIKFFSPTLSLDTDWLNELCDLFISENINKQWTGTSRLEFLTDIGLVKKMKLSGCYKISVGIESIHASADNINRSLDIDLLKRVASLFKQCGIILKGLVMLGVPGQTKENIFELFSLMHDLGIKIRPTSYSPIGDLTSLENITSNDIQRYDKFTYYQHGIKGLSREQYFKLILDPENFKKILNYEK